MLRGATRTKRLSRIVNGYKTQDVQEEVGIEDADAIRSVRAMTQEFEDEDACHVKCAPM